MNIAIRVDASAKMGIGHFMRCLTLADKLRKFGAYTRFICRHIPKHLYEMLINRNHDIVVLTKQDPNILQSELAHAAWLGVNQDFDAAETLAVVADINLDWMIVDNYALDFRWESLVKDKAHKMLVIDDLADRDHTCDIFLNQNVMSDADSLYANKLPVHTKKLIGPQYALLREEFLIARQKVKLRTGPVRNLLVSFGGSDFNNFTTKILDGLKLVENLNLKVDVVISSDHPFSKDIQNICINAGYNCYLQTNEMAELMLKADLAIGAAGATSWERCCLALPAIVITIASNQIQVAREIEKFGAILCLGLESMVHGLATAVAETLVALTKNDVGRIFAMSKQAFSISDGRGTDRVVGSIYG